MSSQAKWVTIKKFMAETGLSYSVIRHQREKGILGAVFDGSRWMIDIAAYNDRLEKEKERVDNIIRFPREKGVYFGGTSDFNESLRLRREESRQKQKTG